MVDENFPQFSLLPRESVGQRWEKYVKKVQYKLVADDIQNNPRKIAKLLTYAGDEVQEIAGTLLKEEDNTYELVVEKLSGYFTPVKNKEFHVFKFRQLCQQKDESIDSFYMRCVECAKHCEFANEDSEIKSQIIQRCLLDKVREKAAYPMTSLREANLSLKDLLTFARTVEATTRQTLERNSTEGPFTKRSTATATTYTPLLVANRLLKDQRLAEVETEDADLKTARVPDPLSRIGGTDTSLWTRPNAKLEQGPELKKPPLRDLSQAKRVSQYNELEENAMVQTTGKKTLYGVIRWMGYLPGRPAPPEQPMVGVEMEDGSFERNTTNTQQYGVYDGYQLFECKSGRGAFFNANRLLKDQRFEEVETEDEVREKYNMEESVIIKGNQTVSPFSEMVLGRFKGIQGHHNSSYIDSTLYSMFAFTQVFDSILHRPKQVDDIPQYGEIQEILREKIVNPLRREHYVDARKVLELRDLLDRLSSVEGLMGEEKDPEDFLKSLLSETMKAEPFIKLSSGQASFMYQLFIEKEEKLRDPTVQDLLQMSFKNSKVKLQEVPPCLILRMPRFGRSYKMFNTIIPSPILDVTDILEPITHTCTLCQKEDLYHWYACEDCTIEHQTPKIPVIEFCKDCYRKHEKCERYQNHRVQAVSWDAVRDRHTITMELFSVVCIETSHYVTFTKCGKSDQWVFFDSMADRVGDLHGFNIPEVKMCVDMADKDLRWSKDPLVRRVLRDAYMCFYRSPVSEMYC